MTETILSNARIVLADEVILGSVVIRDGVIAEIGAPSAMGDDLDGDYLLPGLVELHTDHLEQHYAPRPGVRWNPIAAVQAHDAQVAASGITTVFDTLRMGLYAEGMQQSDFIKLGDAIHEGSESGRFRAQHFIHLRCEVSAADCIEAFRHFETDPLVRLASLMDHSPGQRQFASVEAYKKYYKRNKAMNDAEFDAFASKRIADSERYSAAHRDAVSAACNERGIVLASHDDANRDQVADAEARHVRIAEFPTTVEAAEASRAAGMSILMGAPNVVRGASHTGNASARELLGKGLLDILSSDYIPLSLMQSVFALIDGPDAIALPEATALVTRRPAEAAGLADRGEVAIGKRADLVRVVVFDGVPMIRSVWREGSRVA